MVDSKPIIPTIGAEVVSHTSGEVAALCLALEKEQKAPTEDPVIAGIGQLLQERGVVHLRGKGRLMTPAEMRAVYQSVHNSLGIPCRVPPAPKVASAPTTFTTETDKDGSQILMGRPGPADPKLPANVRGSSFPGFPETNALGRKAGMVDWHGLTGTLNPPHWFQREHCQFHHDGGFNAYSPPPQTLVAMYCEETPKRGAAALRCWAGEADEATGKKAPEVPFAAGATLFYSTKLAMKLATPEVKERARRMNGVYRMGFARNVEGQFPLFDELGLVPRKQTPKANERDRTIEPPGERKPHAQRLKPDDPAAELYSVDPVDNQPEFRCALVQEDEQGEEFILVHSICIECLEEVGVGPLSWQESIDFIEALLAPACRPPNILAADWQPGDFIIWDDRSIHHSPSPHLSSGGEDCYAAFEGEPRLMTRTSMPGSWVPRLVKAEAAVMAGASSSKL